MIMLEGPDLAGKTTLARQLKKMLRGSEIVHRGPPQREDPFTEYLRPLEQMYYEGAWPILDRWHWGEMIYGPVLRDKTIMDVVQHEYIEMACQRYGVSRLLLLPSYDTLMARFDERGDDLMKREQMVKIADAYQHLQLDPDYSVHHTYDTSEPWDHKAVAHIVAESMGYRSRANTLMEWPSYIGPAQPAVLFIGERPANSRRGDFRTALVPYRGTSGHHLLTCLRAVQFRSYHAHHSEPWSSYGLVNAYDGCDNLPALWSWLGCPTVVALGRLAHEAIHRSNIPHGRVPHPQFARRFHNKKKESYGRALLAAAELEDVSKWKG